MITQSCKKVSDLRKLIKYCILSRQRAALIGPPGVGKTQVIKQVAKEMGLPCFTLIGSQCDPTDINGFPVQGSEVKDAKGHTLPVVKFAPREFLVDLQKTGGIIFLDELTCSSSATLAALLRSVQDLVFGEFACDPNRVGLVAAYNPPDIAVNGNELGAPTINRYIQLEYPTGPEACKEWCEELTYNWSQPLNDITFGNNVIKADRIRMTRGWVSTFIKRNPKHWFAFPANEDDRSKPWCSPRAWTNAADAIAAVVSDGLKAEESLPLIAGAVGDGPAAEIGVMLKYSDLPDPEEILKNPNGYKLSGRPDIDLAALDSVVACAAAEPSNERLLAATNVVLEKSIGEGSMLSVEVILPSYRRLVSHVQNNVELYSPDAIQKFQAIRSKTKDTIETAQKAVKAENATKSVRRSKKPSDEQTSSS